MTSYAAQVYLDRTADYNRALEDYESARTRYETILAANPSDPRLEGLYFALTSQRRELEDSHGRLVRMRTELMEELDRIIRRLSSGLVFGFTH